MRVAGRDQVRAELARRGIQTGVHYPVPCHLQPPLRQFASHPLPVAEQAAGELLSLPMFPHMTDGQVDYVCEALRDVLAGRARRAGADRCRVNPAARDRRPRIDRDVLIGYPVSRAGVGAGWSSVREPGSGRDGALRRHDDRAAPADRARRGHHGKPAGSAMTSRSGATASSITAAESGTGSRSTAIVTWLNSPNSENDVFLAPGVSIANDLYPGDERSAELMAGPRIGAGAQIGVNVTILPFVRIGAGALIGAGSVVTRDIPAAVVAFGNPAVPRRAVAELPAMDTRVVADSSSASPYRLSTATRRKETRP